MPLLFLFVAFVCGDTPPAFSLCHNEHTFSRRNLHDFVHRKRQTKDVIGQLFQWCSADAACAEAYHISMQQTADDERAFRYISAHWMRLTDGSVDLMRPFNETVCENESFEDLLRTLWVIALRLAVKETVQLECSANERAVFDAETMQLHCICQADRNCVDASEWRASSINWSHGTIIFASLVVAFVAVRMLLMVELRLRLYHRLLLAPIRAVEATRNELSKNL